MVSAYIFDLITASAKVVIWFWVIFILLPRQIFPSHVKGESRVWLDIVRMSFYTVILVHILVVFRMYDIFSLVGSYVLLYFFLLFIRPPIGLPLTDMERLLSRFVVFGADALEKKINYGEWISQKQHSLKAWIKERFTGSGRVLWWVALIIVLAISAYLRLHDTIRHAALPGDFYTPLSWLKGLTQNRLYEHGIYPSGAFALISAIKQFTLLDEEILLRVAQGLAGILTVTAIYHALRQWTGRRDGALIGAALYGIFAFAQILPGLPLYSDRALPTELALSFMLPTWIFLIRYFTERKNIWLGAAFQGTVLVFLIEPFIGAVTLAGWLFSAPTAIIYGRERVKKASHIALTAVSTILLGGLVYYFAYLGGIKSIDQMMATALRLWSQLIEGTTNSHGMLTPVGPVFLLALFTLPFLFLPAGNDRDLKLGARTGRVLAGLILLCVTVIFELRQLRWADYIVRLDIPVVASFLACTVLGLAFAVICSWIPVLRRSETSSPMTDQVRKWGGGVSWAGFGVTVTIILFLGIVFGPKFVLKSPLKAEYDMVPLKIYEIKKKHMVYSWTVVGSAELLPHLHGRGWYLNGEHFIKTYSPPETYRYDPKRTDIGIPTEHVYIVVEKKVFPAPSVYEKELSRVNMQPALNQWCMKYWLKHDNIEVYFENEDIIIYHIHQDGYAKKIPPYMKLKSQGFN